MILHMSTKNYDHIVYSCWVMVLEGRMDRRTDERMKKSDIFF